MFRSKYIEINRIILVTLDFDSKYSNT